VRASGRVAGGPLRRLGAFAGLGALALFGAGFYDVEWITGLFVGAAGVALLWLSSARLGRGLARARRG